MKMSRKQHKNRDMLAKTVFDAIRRIDPAKLDLVSEVLQDVAICCVEDEKRNTRKNGDHRGARKRQEERPGDKGLAALSEMKTHDSDNKNIGGILVSSDEELEEEDEEEEEEEESSSEKEEEEEREHPETGTWMHVLIGLTFGDMQERTKWKVQDVYLHGGDDNCAKDDEEYEGWVVEYYPTGLHSTPAPDGPGLEGLSAG